MTPNADTFRVADTQHIDQAAQRVRRAAAERLVRARDDYDDQSALVQAQAARKRGHLPLRQLFSAAPDVMTALKPCWAMSPLVVSQLLPGDRPYFDVIVFDEASQIVPADAIPAILRARASSSPATATNSRPPTSSLPPATATATSNRQSTTTAASTSPSPAATSPSSTSSPLASAMAEPITDLALPQPR